MTVTLLSLLLAAPQAAPAPALSITSMLDGLNFFLDNTEPGVIVSSVSVAFAPSGPFTPKLVISQNGQMLREVTFQREIVRGGAFASVRSRIPGQISLGTENGDRTFEFFVDDKLAGRFTVNLTKTTGGDALNPTVRWKIVGPWKDLAVLRHKPADGTRQDILLTTWVAQHELIAGERTVKAHLKKGATTVASTRDIIPNGSRYLRQELPLARPNGSTIEAKDLLGLNGNYTIEVSTGKRVLRSWKLSIAGGAIVAHPRSDHTKTAPELWLAPREQMGTTVSPFTSFWLAP